MRPSPTPQTTAVTVARYFIYLSSQEQELEFLSHMRLQKLLYYAQGWSLAVRRRVMFEGVIEAWRHGPVVREAYTYFKSNQDDPIPFEQGDDPPGLTGDDKAFIRSIWESYKGYSAAGLRSKTHQETPWVEARRGLPDDAASNREIPPGAMGDFFRRECDRQLQDQGLTINGLWESQEDVTQGRLMSLDDALARLSRAGDDR